MDIRILAGSTQTAHCDAHEWSIDVLRLADVQADVQADNETDEHPIGPPCRGGVYIYSGLGCEIIPLVTQVASLFTTKWFFAKDLCTGCLFVVHFCDCVRRVGAILFLLAGDWLVTGLRFPLLHHCYTIVTPLLRHVWPSSVVPLDAPRRDLALLSLLAVVLAGWRRGV